MGPPTAPAPAEEARLVRRIAKGDASAFAEFYRLTSASAYSSALRMTRSQSQADDLVQNVYFELWQRAHQFDSSRGSARAWLLIRIRSRALDQLDAEARRDLAEPQITGPTAIELPDESLAKAQTDRGMQHEVRSLPPLQQEAVRLAYWEGLSASEIAGRLGVPVGTVKTRVRLGLRRLAARLAGW